MTDPRAAGKFTITTGERARSRQPSEYQAARGVVSGPELEQELIGFVRERIAGFNAPRSVCFVDQRPRTETGKLVKAELKHRYGAS